MRFKKPRIPALAKENLENYRNSGLHPELGPDFIRALARQDLVPARDYPQELDAVGQGRYPVLIGGSDALAEQRIKQGVRKHTLAEFFAPLNQPYRVRFRKPRRDLHRSK